MDKIEIPIITENGTTTLLTAGKYCDKNIDIKVEIPDRYEEGRTDEYMDFWGPFQQGGTRIYYRYGFCGSGWNKDNFKPPYDIIISNNAEGAFTFFDYQTEDRTKLVDLSDFNIEWDNVTNLTKAFYSANLENTGFVDATNCTSLSSTFASTGSKGFITKITLKVKAATTYTTTFNSQQYLTDLIFTEGSEIGQNGLNVQWSPLTHDSLISIIDALVDKSADTSGTTWKVTLGTNNLAKLSEAEKLRMDDKGWDYA